MIRKLQLLVLLLLVGGNCKAQDSWWDLGSLRKLSGKDFVSLYLASWIFQQRLVPYVFGIGVKNFNEYFYAKEVALKKIEAGIKSDATRLSAKQKTILSKMTALGVQFNLKTLSQSDRNKVEEKIKKLNEKLAKNKEQKSKLRAEAKEKLGEDAAKKIFNLKQAASAA